MHAADGVCWLNVPSSAIAFASACQHVCWAGVGWGAAVHQPCVHGLRACLGDHVPVPSCCSSRQIQNAYAAAQAYRPLGRVHSLARPCCCGTGCSLCWSGTPSWAKMTHSEVEGGSFDRCRVEQQHSMQCQVQRPDMWDSFQRLAPNVIFKLPKSAITLSSHAERSHTAHRRTADSMPAAKDACSVQSTRL